MLSVSGDVILSEFDDTLDGTDDELPDEDDGISSLGSLSSTGTQNKFLECLRYHLSDRI